jgi:hypothetical protein
MTSATSIPTLHYAAPARLREVVSSLDRTEDIAFSPTSRRLAIAAFRLCRIVVFDLDLSSVGDRASVTLTGGVELSSRALRNPHGVDFIDNDTIVVASRAGDVDIFSLPPGGVDVPLREVSPVSTWPAGETSLLQAPGALTVIGAKENLHEILICNNNAHTVTKHWWSRQVRDTNGNGAVLLKRYLDVPDGLACSTDLRWIAVCNHTLQCVLVYRNSSSLSADAAPTGILRGVRYPHGVCFTADGNHLFVADAGAPYIHIYAQQPHDWSGVRYPEASLKIMDDDTFRRGHHHHGEGGPKGLDIASGSSLLAVTSHYLPLAFFSVPRLLERAVRSAAREQKDLEFSCELTLLDDIHRLATRLRAVAADFEYMRNSRSWRSTEFLRRLDGLWQRRRG